MTADSKKHHFVPQSLLRNFSVFGKQKQIYVYDKQQDKSFATSIENAGSKNQFHIVETDGVRENYESEFDSNDTQLYSIIGTITKNRSLSNLTQEQQFALADVVALQITRTPLIRSSFLHSEEQVKGIYKDIGYPLDDNDATLNISENDACQYTRDLLHDHKSITESLRQKLCVLFESSNDNYMISDNPVIIFNPFPHIEPALNTSGSVIAMPINPTLYLAYMCPSYKQRAYQSLANGFEKCANVPIKSDFVAWLNTHQVARCNRFVYSAKNDFDLARDYLQKHSDRRCVKTIMRIGKMGEGHAQIPGMPKGYQLALMCKSEHTMIPITEVADTTGSIEARTQEIEELNYAVKHFAYPIEARLYEDGQEIHSIRDVIVQVITTGITTRFQVIPRNESDRKLYAQMDKRSMNT